MAPMTQPEPPGRPPSQIIDSNARWISLACALVLIILITSFLQIYRNSQRLLRDDAWVAHTHEVISHVEGLLRSLIDLETGQRGYVIAGDPVFLEPFDKELATVPHRLSLLRELTEDNPRQTLVFDQIEPLIKRKIEVSSRVIEARTHKGEKFASEVVRRGEGKRIMDQIRALIAQILAEENRLLALRSDQSRKVAENSNIQFLIISVVDGLTVLLAFLLIRRQVRRRQDVELQLSQNEEQCDFNLKNATEREAQARLAAERAILFKEELLTNLYHELRTPLAAILGFAEIIECESEGTEKTKHACQVIRRNGQNLLGLIENLLSVAQAVKQGDIPPTRPIAVLPLIRAAVDTVEAARQAKGIAIHVRDDSHNAAVAFNPERGVNVFVQLLDNAIKFSRPGESVDVHVEKVRDGQVSITITDRGVGIASHVLPHVFESFRQGDNSLTRAHGGLGLGLFISRFFVETYGGTIRAESQGEGQGARFIVTLPTFSHYSQIQSARDTLSTSVSSAGH